MRTPNVGSRFGFPAGDFINAVKLIIDISNALKDTGGAAENYLEVLTELKLLKDILLELQKVPDGTVVEQSNNSFLNMRRLKRSSNLNSFLFM